MPYEARFLLALLVTLALELPVIILLVKIIFKAEKISFFRLIFIGIMASCLTLPYIWFILPAYHVSILKKEIFVIVIEAIIFMMLLPLKKWQSIALSLSANIVSYFAGIYILLKFIYPLF